MKLLKPRSKEDFPPNFDPSKFYERPEIIKPLDHIKYNTEPGLYMVSSYGKLINTKTNTYVPRELSRDKNMYIIVSYRDKDGKEIFMPIHQIVCDTFSPFNCYFGYGPYTDNFMVVNHKDGVKWHNEFTNLEWVTQSENADHANNNNLVARAYGEDNGYSKLTDDQYRKICELLEQNYLPYQINQILNYGFDITNICQKIRSGKSGLAIAKDYDFSNLDRKTLNMYTEDQVRIICQCLEKGITNYIWILDELGYNRYMMSTKEYHQYRDAIYHIRKRDVWTEISKDYDF